MAKGKVSEDVVKLIVEAETSKLQQAIHESKKSLKGLEDECKRNIVHGRVSALGGCGLHTARNTKEKQGIRIDALLFWGLFLLGVRTLPF